MSLGGGALVATPWQYAQIEEQRTPGLRAGPAGVPMDRGDGCGGHGGHRRVVSHQIPGRSSVANATPHQPVGLDAGTVGGTRRPRARAQPTPAAVWWRHRCPLRPRPNAPRPPCRAARGGDVGRDLVARATDRSSGRTHFRALGTTVTLAVADVDVLNPAEAVLRDELEAIDRACSRFRSDSEIWRLYGDGRPVQASPLLYEAVSVACAVAERSDGAVDPTVGSAVEALGYDRDFAEVPAIGEPLGPAPVPAPGWWRIELDDDARSVAVPPGVRLDLGASAKALVADRAASRIASMTDCRHVGLRGRRHRGVGPSATTADGPSGSPSTASDPSRTVPWCRSPRVVSPAPARPCGPGAAAARRLHHIVDPATGDCASDYWRLVSVAAASCVDANAFSTAAVVWGESAPERLEARGLPSRLVRHDGVEVCVAGWPRVE